MTFGLNLLWQSGVVQGVGQYIYSIGYSGLDAVQSYTTANNESQACSIKNSLMLNKAGFIVAPSVASAQAAVRSGASAFLTQSTCPGFGICGNLIDGDDEDVWPITAVTASRSAPKPTKRSRRCLYP